MNLEMQHEAMFYDNVHLEIKTVTDNTEQQIADIEDFIRKKADILIVAPNQASPVTPVVEKAYQQGIPVILVDRKIDSDNFTAFIGADNRQIGSEVGNYVAKLLGDKGNIVEIRGLNGSSPDAERHEGFASAIANYPEINILTSADGAWLKNVADEKMTEILRNFQKIDLVFAHNDRMAMGAYNAAARQNRADSILFIGIDALPGSKGGIAQVLNGKLKATFIYPTNGDKIIQLALNILQNKPFEKHNTLYTNVVDESNARVLKLQTDAIIEQDNKIDVLNSQIEELKDIDKVFIENLQRLIEEKIEDSELNVDDLGKSVGLSHSQLYRKVKSLTGYSPNEFVRIIRLKKAGVLLSSSNCNIAEIAYDTGFTSPSYFTKCFRDFYGESPTEYQKLRR